MTAPLAPRHDAAYLAWNTVASHDDHDDARRTVERLAGAGFPVEHLDIVGADVRLVERVTGGLTRGRRALAGAAQGVWAGLAAGLLLSLFATGAGVSSTIFATMLVGAASGAALALVARTSAAGRTGFASIRSLVAARYDIVARDGFAEQAREALRRLDQTAQPGLTL